MIDVTRSASEELCSTVAALPDQVLLEQTRMLARHEQALQLSVLDHLREIEARRLYLRRGFSSLFDYTVRELRYTEAAAWRRIKAMRLCRETRGVRERLQDGSLNLSNAALLQNSFERWERSGGGPGAAASVGAGRGVAASAGAGPGVAGSAGAGQGAAGSAAAGTSAAAGGGSAAAAAPGKGAGAPVPVLDAHARQELVERAMGKSTRQVQQMLAEVDPEAAAPAERLRPLGDGRWELKAVIDADCQRGLQQLRELLSHVDPHLTVGQLVGRLVREGVDRYDPSRPPRRKRRKSDPAGDGCSTETAGREPAGRGAAAAKNPRRAEKSAAPTSSSPSAPKRSAKPTAAGTSPAVLPAGGGSAEASPKRGHGPPPGSPPSAPKCVAPRAERAGSAGDAVATELTSAPKARAAAGRSIAVPSSHGAGSAEQTSAAKLGVAAGRSIPEQSSRGSGSAEQTSAAKLGVAAGRSIPEQSSRGSGSAEQTSAAKLGVAGGAGSVAPTVAAKSGKSSGRSIPAAVRREVWRRDQGCCSYVDRHTGRRCGSRFFLELDHIVPVARGGGAEPANLRLRCSAHHRYRHGRRQRSAPRDSVT